MEIVHDLDVEAAAVAREQGARLWRAPTVTTSPGFAWSASWWKNAWAPAQSALPSGRTGPGPTSAPSATAPCRRSPGYGRLYIGLAPNWAFSHAVALYGTTNARVKTTPVLWPMAVRAVRVNFRYR